MNMQKETSGIIYKILNIFCIVIIGLVNKAAMKELSAFQTFFLSCLSSLIIVSVIVKFQRKKSLTSVICSIDKQFIWIAVINFISLCAFLQALKAIDMNIVISIMYLTPIIASVLAMLILREEFSPRATIALIISILGTIIITRPTMTTSVATIGIVSAFVSAFGWAFHDLLLKRQAIRIDWTTQSFIILILCTPMALPFAVVTWQPLNYTQIKFILLLGALYTMNKMFLMKALANTRLVMLAPISYTKLIFTATFSYMFFNEMISTNTILGSTLIILATILIMYSTRKKSPIPAVREQ